MSHNRNHRDNSLSGDQRMLLDMYHNFYNQTSRQIETLYELQNEIRMNINQIVGVGERNNERTTDRSNDRNNNLNSRTHRGSNRQSTSRTQSANGTNLENSQSRIFYVDGVPYLLDLTHIWRRPTYNANANTTARSFYENVLVAPTQNQIENATRRVYYSDIENPLNNSCPITMEYFDDDSNVTQILPCGHLFTPSEIESWFRTNTRCPVCRYDIRDYTPSSILNTTGSTRETRRQVTEPGDDDEEQPVTNNRPSNNVNINASTRRDRSSYSNNNIETAMSTITEELLNSIFPQNNRTTSILDPSLNSLFYDSSSNHYLFEGFLRR